MTACELFQRLRPSFSCRKWERSEAYWVSLIISRSIIRKGRRSTRTRVRGSKTIRTMEESMDWTCARILLNPS